MPKSSKVQRALSAALHLNPLHTPYKSIKTQFSAGTAALNLFRTTLLDTMIVPLEIACQTLPPAPDLDVKLVLLRRYIRERAIDGEDGRSHRPFWPKVDAWYTDMTAELGLDFRNPWWQRFLDETFDKEDEVFTPSIGRALFTWTAMIIADDSMFEGSASPGSSDNGEAFPEEKERLAPPPVVHPQGCLKIARLLN
ncbi:hypothetical protein DFH09DRAFT_1199351 [Mycena vulgaris]|nr:hypothetical protein DFH09DRAFT_1199351 [Mycena vulgaris]